VRIAPRCWGIYREPAHSPNRESDDAEILRATAEKLAEKGFEVELKSPEELPATDDAAGIPQLLFVMCMKEEVVRRLAAWERQGVRVVNRPESIRNTDRDRTIARVLGDGIPFPESVLVSTERQWKGSRIPVPCWIKRGDYHSTHSEDVSMAKTEEEVAGRLAALAARGIDRAVLQRHVPGDLIKFYGVRTIERAGAPLSWFEWFYHRDQVLSNHPFDPNDLRAAVGNAARALGLEVFGGDAIAAGDGRIFLIDLNAWPSFALYRRIAAEKIAAHLVERFPERELVSGISSESS
jgi:glutathione synthase/RimK-type ligase-like ATP-grasp enzyme